MPCRQYEGEAGETMSYAGARSDRARCVALTQEHRGHGVSTATYYVGRALVDEGLRVLLVDVSGRRARLHTLVSRSPIKNFGLWTPTLARPGDLGALLAQARRQTAGRVDVLLLDADAGMLAQANALESGVDYVVVAAEANDSGQAGADRVAERLRDAIPPMGRVGVLFTRCDAGLTDDLPEKTNRRGLPILGCLPADYLLAAGEDYSLKGNEPSEPHEKYLQATHRVARTLKRVVPLHRVILNLEALETTAPVAHDATAASAHPTM